MKQILILLALAVPLVSARAELPGGDYLAELLLSVTDGNADGQLDAGEWQEALREGFRQMDGDGNGAVSGEEISALAPALADELGESGAQACVVLIRALVMSFDGDKDGSTTLQEYDDVAAGWISKADADQDSVLDRAELEGLPARLLALTLTGGQ